jgi:hypothetical protein
LEITHHVHGYYGRTKAMKIDQDVAKGENPEDEPAVA